jgi:hypothetical protein
MQNFPMTLATGATEDSTGQSTTFNKLTMKENS